MVIIETERVEWRLEIHMISLYKPNIGMVPPGHACAIAKESFASCCKEH